MVNKFPLVSVVVITYNSAKTVVETLDSIHGQTYGNIELIVSDDCSSDDTVSVVNGWVDTHRNRFTGVGMVTTGHNSGVSLNINRGVRGGSGKYLKVIAGDDKLKPEAIEVMTTFMEETGYDFCISDIEVFAAEGVTIPQGIVNVYKRYFNNVKETLKQKKRRLAYEYAMPTIGSFYTRELFDRMGGADERFPMWDEFPFVHNVIYAGIDIKPLDMKLVQYRYSGTSLSQVSGKVLLNKAYFRDFRRVFYCFQAPSLIRYGMIGKLLSRILRLEVYNCRYKSSFFPKMVVKVYDWLKTL